MATSRIESRRHPWIVMQAALFLIIITITSVYASTISSQDSGDNIVPTDAGAGENAAHWSAFAVSSARSSVTSESSAVRVLLAPGDRASFSRPIDLGPAPLAILCRFNLALSDVRASKIAAQVFRVGSSFGALNLARPNVVTYGRLGLNTTGSGTGFQLRDLVAGRNSSAFQGTQAITWALNNSGRILSYAAPNGTMESIANDRMDVWVGRNKVFDDISVTIPGGSMTDVEWSWDTSSGVTNFDNFDIENLEGEIARTPSGAAPEASLASAPPASEEGSMELYRPSPNPFALTTRFVYAIPNGFERVDIGVFDLAGRRIRNLVHQVQSTGQYEVRWDGRSDSGARVKHGVYFLRASVGSSTRVARVVYLFQ